MKNLTVIITIIALSLGAAVLSVLLYFANRKPPIKTEAQESNVQKFQTMDGFVQNAMKHLNRDGRTKWDEIQKKVNSQTGTEKKRWLDSAAYFWDLEKKPDIASVYSQKVAENSGLAKDWFFAGQRFYFAVRFVKDPSELPALYSNAIACMEKGLKLEPNNTDAKIDLAACMVEGTQDPMKGVTLLREIEKTDSMNLKLQLNFAFFSVRSKQWDRAISRFNKVIKIDTTYLEAYLHLADAYEQKGELDNTISSLEKYAAKTDNLLAKTTIKEYIAKLKKSAVK
ncbi:MAG: hypothetical protein IAF38_10255 [Bacteroidia bacterium]|nr:hypothetical protein [Bacteroidia bacterium]